MNDEIRYECPRCRTLYLEEVTECDYGCGGVIKRGYSLKTRKVIEPEDEAPVGPDAGVREAGC